MDTSEINYRTLRKIQQIEKETPVLSEIGSNFYTVLSGYLKDLDERLGKESSPQKHSLLKDEIQNTRKIAVNIYEQREKKIILAVISKARGGSPDLKNLTNVEKELFDSVLKLMKQSREQLLTVKTKKEEIEKTVESNKEKNENEKQENPNPIIRVTEDIPEFIGTDTKKYHLRKGDVLSLPVDMSDTLTKRGAAKKINE